MSTKNEKAKEDPEAGKDALGPLDRPLPSRGPRAQPATSTSSEPAPGSRVTGWKDL